MVHRAVVNHLRIPPVAFAGQFIQPNILTRQIKTGYLLVPVSVEIKCFDRTEFNQPESAALITGTPQVLLFTVSPGRSLPDGIP
ncbi:hypothetical protein AAIR21_14660 [Enterobacter sp. PTB]